MILKHFYEDFKVVEVLNNELSATNTKTPRHCFALFRVEKQGLTTIKAAMLLALKLGVSPKNVSYAGLKDKQALTVQYFTVKNSKGLSFTTSNLRARFLGWVDKPLKSGMITANEFEITVRGLKHETTNLDVGSLLMPNYFDEQRFSANNAVIGELLVKKQFFKACKALRFECSESNALAQLNKADKKLLRLLVNSFQSLLWNKALSKALSSCVDCYKVEYSQGLLCFPKRFENLEQLVNVKLLMPGFGFEKTRLKHCVVETYNNTLQELLKDKGLTHEDFIIRSVQGTSSEAVNRALFVKLQDLTIKFSNDEAFKSLKAVLKFKLPPGSYGTILTKQLFGEIKS